MKGRDFSVGCMVVGAVGVVLGAAQPWLLTGRTRRSAFALARSARRLGLVRTLPRRVALDLLLLAPLLAGLAIALVSWRRPRWAVAPALGVGAIGFIGGMAGFSIPGHIGRGPLLTMLTGMMCLFGAASFLWTHVNHAPLARGRAL